VLSRCLGAQRILGGNQVESAVQTQPVRPFRPLALGIAVFLFGFGGCAANAYAKTLDVYVSPSGVDTANGMRAEAPVASLARVQDIVAENAQGYDEVRVLFAPGIYRGQGVEWRTFPGVWTRFQPSSRKGAVIFDGQGGQQSVFFQGLAPIPTNDAPPVSMKLSFSGLTIRNYCEGISLKAWADDVRRPGGRDVVVTESRFENIGSKFDPVKVNKRPRGNCTAAVRLQGVGHGKIEGNKFQNIVNLFGNQTGSKKFGRGQLHAIYIANMSQDNKIIGNHFDNFSGDPIRIRDKSDRTEVSRNIFGSPSDNTKPGEIHAISQWYCNQNVRACVQRRVSRNECESAELELKNNRIEGKNVADYADRAEGKPTCAK